MQTPKIMSKNTQETLVNMKPKKLTPRYKAMMKLIVIGVEEMPRALFIKFSLASKELSLLLSSKMSSLSLFIKRIAISNVNKAINGKATLT